MGGCFFKFNIAQKKEIVKRPATVWALFSYSFFWERQVSRLAKKSDGQIAIDLVLNKNGFEKSINGITSLAKKAGATLAAALSVKKLVDFGKSCLSLGSDLQEVQNVVDVTFPSMSKQIDKFAQSAASKFGLSETMAKKFSGTFGSMAEAFGFSEKEAYKMSTALTGLAGDVASFYNISQDEAYTKLKSVFSGETETLKELGIVMTQSALDSYALANGYGKVTSKMTEAEKVSLRFAFVQSQLSNAAGDFARTSNSWANQTRILSLQFDSLKASIGQGLINAFTPVIKVINTVMAKLQTLANAFKNLTENVFGNAGSSSSSEKAATATSNAMNTASNASGTVAKNTKKAAKEAKKMQASVMGFDKLNKLDSKDTSDTGSGSAGSGSGGNNIGIKANVDTKGIDKASKKLEKLKKVFGTLKNQFVKGFKIGLGDTSVLDSIKGNLASIKNSILEIVSSKEVQASFGNLLLTIAESAGKIAGSFASIALTITDNLTGGIAKYLAKDKDRIKGYLVRMFDIRAEISKLVSDFAVEVADIFTVFRSDDAKQITADIIKIFSDAYMGITELALKIGRDATKLITKPIVKNSDKIKNSLSNTLKPVNKMVHTVAKSIEKTFDKMNEVYDKKVAPAIRNITDGISKLIGAICDNYNQYIAPTINELAGFFGEMWKNSIQPTINEMIGAIGDICDCIGVLFNFLEPKVEYLINNVAPIISENLMELGIKFKDVISNMSKTLGSFVGILRGLVKFIEGVFTGDWEKAWSGVKLIFKSFCEFVQNIVKTILSVLDLGFSKVEKIVSTPFRVMKEACINIWNSLKNKIVEIATSIYTKSSEKVKNLKTVFVDVFGKIKSKVVSIFSGMWGGIKNTINSILSGVEKMANGVIKSFNKMIEAINNFGFKMPDWLPKKWANKKLGFNLKTLSEVSIPKLANGGYVEANTPQLAMIGDNKHQGEVVAPEDKLQAMVDSAVAQNTAAIISALREIFKGNSGGDIELTVNIGNKKLMREVLKTANKGNKRIGKTVYNV